MKQQFRRMDALFMPIKSLANKMVGKKACPPYLNFREFVL
jgi:hypothetical protein